MKTILGILCLTLPVVAAYWDLIAPAIKKVFTHKTQPAQ